MERNSGNPADQNLSAIPARSVPTLQNSDDLLGESIRYLSPEQRSNLMEIAAQENMRLQIKQAECNIDNTIVESKTDNAIGIARKLNGHRFVGYRIDTEHAGTQLTIQKGCLAQLLLIIAPAFGVGVLIFLG